MEHVITVQQAQNDFMTIIEQVRNLGSSFVITENGKTSIKITIAEEKPKRQTYYGLMNDDNGNVHVSNRNAGFLKNTQNTRAPENFDRMNEDEIFKMFAGD